MGRDPVLDLMKDRRIAKSALRFLNASSTLTSFRKRLQS
jgi:hypothetical protein